jgi:hypothetical protein
MVALEEREVFLIEKGERLTMPGILVCGEY